VLTIFGKRSAGSTRRQNECLVLEPSEMIVVNIDLIKLFQRYENTRNAHHQLILRLIMLNSQK